MPKDKKKKKSTHNSSKSTGPVISLCMMVKDEERLLPQCLDSVKDVADEIIVVDTGSTDKTVEIAESYGAHVYHHPWNDSFSDARNLAMQYATGNWIFTIDADEELVKKDIPMIRTAIQDDNIDAVLIQIVNLAGKSGSKGIHNQERIIRNNGIIHYEGRVHNRLVGITRAKVYPIRLMHYGYDLGGDEGDKKYKRTIALLKKDLADNPDNPATHHYLCCSFLSRNMYKEAIEHGLKTIQLAELQNNRDATFLWTRYNVSLAYYRLNNLPLAEDIACQALTIYPDHIDSHFLMIVICFDQRRWKDLIAHANHYLRLLKLVDTNPAYFGTLVSCSLNEAWNIHVLLGIARYEIGDPKFTDSFKKAIKVSPEPFLAARAAGIYFANAGVAELAKSYLEMANKFQQGDETVAKCLDGLLLKKPTISCVMIVKNEEVFLEKCLLSIKDWVDEIVIVDTGSDDDTVNIARRFTNKIFYHPWEGNFSKARNQAASYATGDWIFIIDGDEELNAGNGPKLKEAVTSAGEADCFLITTVSTYGNGQKTSRHNSERLFRNNGIIHYESIVHNRLVGYISTKPTKIEITHYGYDVDEKKANEKFIRTTELLKRQIAEAPEDPMPHHYLGTSYLTRGLFRECILESEKAIELAEKNGDDHPLYLWSHQNAAMSYYYLGDIDHAKSHALRTIDKFENHMDAYYVLTLVAAEQKEWDTVRLYGEKYLERRAFYEANSDKAGVLVNTTMGEGSAVNLLIGHAWHGKGDKKMMRNYYRKAETLATNKPWQSWYNAATYHMDVTNDYAMAQELLDKALHLGPKEEEIWYSLAKLASLVKNRAGELNWLVKLHQAGNKDENILSRLAVFLFEDGKTADAIRVFQDLLANSPDNLQTLLNIGIAYKQLQNYPKAIESFMRLIELDPANPKPWYHLSELSETLGRLDEAEIFGARAHALHS